MIEKSFLFFLLLFSVFFLFFSGINLEKTDVFLIPFIYSIVLLISLLVLFFKKIEKTSEESKLSKKTLTIISITFLYLLFLNFYGFLMPTLLFCCITPISLNNKNYFTIGILSLVWTFGIFNLFKYVFQITLP